MTDTAAPEEAALAAFLRGIERRGFVLAQAQCGDPVRAQAAIDGAIRAFRAEAAQLALARWPACFWQRLLAQPVLREWARSSADQPLAGLSAGPRAALLLRLVAGLDHVHGADVLGVSPEAFRHALYRAVRALHAQGIDDTQLRALRERLQLHAKQLPETGRHAAPVRAASLARRPMRVPAHPPRWLRRVLLVLLVFVILAFAASFVRKPAVGAVTGGFSALRAQPPAGSLSATAAAVSSADFGLLDDPAGTRIARELDLYAWYASGEQATAPASGLSTQLPQSTAPETSTPDPETAPTEGGGAR